MQRAGFVLAGGRSSRMGRDKALLPFGGGTLVEFVAGQVLAAAQRVALIADPGVYGQFGFPVYADRFPGCGPLGGLHTALSMKLGEWNLVVACDMPRLTPTILARLCERAEAIRDPRLACVAPVSGTGEYEPLCAVYHTTCLPAVERALGEKQFKMRFLLLGLKTVGLEGEFEPCFTNINTPKEWIDLKRNSGA